MSHLFKSAAIRGAVRRVQRTVLQVLPVVFFIAAWEILSVLLGADRLPSIGQIASLMGQSLMSDRFIESQGGGTNGYWPHVLSTFSNFLIGFLPGAFFGFLLAVSITEFSFVRFFLEPFLELFRVLPPLLVVPFCLLAFETQYSVQPFSVAVYTTFIICVYSTTAIENVPRNYLLLSSLFGARRWRRVVTVVIPAALPEALGGIRVASALALGIAVVSEYLAAPTGIGRILKFAISTSKVDLILVGVVWVVFGAILIDSTILWASRIALRWTTRERLVEATEVTSSS